MRISDWSSDVCSSDLAMGLRHIVTLTFREDTEDDQVHEIVEALRRLPSQIDEIKGYVVGTDAELAEGNAHLGIVADFDSVEGYEVYRAHPADRKSTRLNSSH